MNQVSKTILTATSLVPVLATIGVARWADGQPLLDLVPWLGTAVGLAVLAWLLARAAATRLGHIQVSFVELKNSDKEVLAFLLTYLLPLVGSEKLGLGTRTPVTLFVFGIIFLAVYHADAYDFNPVLGCFGYHFYEVKLAGGVTMLVLSRRPIRLAPGSVEVVELADSTLLAV